MVVLWYELECKFVVDIRESNFFMTVALHGTYMDPVKLWYMKDMLKYTRIIHSQIIIIIILIDLSLQVTKIAQGFNVVRCSHLFQHGADPTNIKNKVKITLRLPINPPITLIIGITRQNVDLFRTTC